MTSFNITSMLSQENQIKQIPVDLLVPYHNHQFSLYQGERLDDMVESIRKNGVITPIICRPQKDKYEILVGHNRWNAAKIAGLEFVPAIIKEQLSDEEAEIYVVESNLIQRGFNDLKTSEQAKVIALRYSEMFSQGKRNDIINELRELEIPGSTYAPPGHKLNSRDKVGEEYGLSKNTVARLLRIDKLDEHIKQWVDDGLVSVRAGVELSYLDGESQDKLFCVNNDGDRLLFKITEKKAKQLRDEISSDTENKREAILRVLNNKKEANGKKKVNIDTNTYSKYFSGMDNEEISKIIAEALKMYYKTKGTDLNEKEN